MLLWRSRQTTPPKLELSSRGARRKRSRTATQTTYVSLDPSMWRERKRRWNPPVASGPGGDRKTTFQAVIEYFFLLSVLLWPEPLQPAEVCAQGQPDPPAGPVLVSGQLQLRRAAGCGSSLAGVRAGVALPLGEQLSDLWVSTSTPSSHATLSRLWSGYSEKQDSNLICVFFPFSFFFTTCQPGCRIT